MRKKSNIRSEYKSIRKPSGRKLSNRFISKNSNKKRDDDDGSESKIDNNPKNPNTSGNYINENI